MYLRIFFLFSLVKYRHYTSTLYCIYRLYSTYRCLYDYTINSVSQQHDSILLYKSVYISQNKNPLVFIFIIKNIVIDHSIKANDNVTFQAVYHANLYLLRGVYYIDYCL